MESPTTASQARNDTPLLLSAPELGRLETSGFRGRNADLAARIRARLENERAVLAQALEAFQAELLTQAA